MYNTNVSVCPRTIFNVKSVGENTCNNPNYNIHFFLCSLVLYIIGSSLQLNLVCRPHCLTKSIKTTAAFREFVNMSYIDSLTELVDHTIDNLYRQKQAQNSSTSDTRATDSNQSSLVRFQNL